MPPDLAGDSAAVPEEGPAVMEETLATGVKTDLMAVTI
jgi:hypothetical protein